MAFKIGRAVVLHLGAKKLVVGHDARTSSDELVKQLIEGITSTGCDVTLIDETTTPLFYFCVNSFKTDGGIMVTASHNIAGVNGFKIVGPGGVSIGGDSSLKEIEQLLGAPVPEGAKKGSIDKQKLIDDYINFLIELSGIMNPVSILDPSVQGVKKMVRPDYGRMRIVADASNGVAVLELKNLFKKVNVNVIPLFWDIDGRFPNHSPDISQRTNLRHLQEKVREMQADFGVAFDGDGDRIAVVDNLGEVIWPDYILGLLYADMGQPKTVYDLRISHSIKEYITNGMESPVGYVNIKKRMQESGADLGGELSGHFFFQDLRYAESPMLVLLKLLMMVNTSKKPIAKLVDPFRKYAHSGEIRIEINEKEQAANIVEKLKQKYSDGNISEMDGITNIPIRVFLF